MGFLNAGNWYDVVGGDPTGAKEAAGVQTMLQLQAQNYQREMMAPWVKSGQENLAQLNQLMEPGGYLEPTRRFTTEDWRSSPEYAVFNTAQQAAQANALDALQAQAGASGMYGGGTYANQLAQNLGNLYAQYQPASLAASQQNWNADREMAYNMLASLANPDAAKQLSSWAGTTAANIGNALGTSYTATGAARRAGMSQMGIDKIVKGLLSPSGSGS